MLSGNWMLWKVIDFASTSTMEPWAELILRWEHSKAEFRVWCYSKAERKVRRMRGWVSYLPISPWKAWIEWWKTSGSSLNRNGRVTIFDFQYTPSYVLMGTQWQHLLAIEPLRQFRSSNDCLIQPTVFWMGNQNLSRLGVTAPIRSHRLTYPTGESNGTPITYRLKLSFEAFEIFWNSYTQRLRTGNALPWTYCWGMRSQYIASRFHRPCT